MLNDTIEVLRAAMSSSFMGVYNALLYPYLSLNETGFSFLDLPSNSFRVYVLGRCMQPGRFRTWSGFSL